MNGADASVVFTDGAFGGTHTWTAYGNAQIDTAQSKFGEASGLFDGDGDYLSTPDSDDWYFAAGNFTIDFWVRFLALPTDHDYLVAQDDGGGYNMWGIYRNNSGNKLGFYAAVGGVAKADYIMTNDWGGVINTWYHIAVVRNGTSLNIYIDGVSQTLTGTTVIGTNDLGNLAQPLYIGAFSAGLYYFNGWIDELRISKGIARWTANFSSSLPTGEYGVDPTNYPRAVAGAVGWVGGTVKRLASAKRKITGAIYDSLRTQKDILENLIPDPHRAVKNMESLSQAFKGGQGWELCPRYSR
jgi:hypothetical protein